MPVSFIIFVDPGKCYNLGPDIIFFKPSDIIIAEGRQAFFCLSTLLSGCSKESWHNLPTIQILKTN